MTLVDLEDVAYPVTGYVDGEPFELDTPKALREALQTDFFEPMAGGEPYYDANGNQISPDFSRVRIAQE